MAEKRKSGKGDFDEELSGCSSESWSKGLYEGQLTPKERQ
jgi:hypothetical protein